MNQNCSSCPCTVLCVEKFFHFVLLVVNNLNITAIITRWKINQSCTQRNSFQCTFLNFRLEVLYTSVQHGSNCSLWWTVMGSLKFSRILRTWLPRLWKSCYFGSWQKQLAVWNFSIKGLQECCYIDHCGISWPLFSSSIKFFSYEDSWSTVSWSFSIPGRNWGDSRMN